jgi:hypothetical protein
MIAQISTLQSLALANCRNIHTEGFSHICRNLTNLRSFSFQNEALLDADAALWLPHLSKLTYLDFFQCSLIGDATLGAIATSLPSLKALDLGQCRQVTDAGIALLTALQQIEYVYFSRGVGFTGATVNLLTTLTKLWLAYLPNLDNSGTRSNKYCTLWLAAHVICEWSEGVAGLSKLTNLIDLRLNDCQQVNEKGIIQALPSLGRLKSLHLECGPYRKSGYTPIRCL